MCVPIFLQKFSVEREFSLTNAKYYTTRIFCHEKTDLPIVRFLGLTFGGRYIEVKDSLIYIIFY